MFSQTEENYLKAIYKLQSATRTVVSTNELAEEMGIKPSSVTDMLKKLSAKKLIVYQKYQGVSLTGKGKSIALKIIRKHRLWEFFLVEKLHFTWDEVHEIAEQLEHIKSEVLIDSLDDFLGNPKFDPHGDPIPDKNNRMAVQTRINLSDMQPGTSGIIDAVKNSSDTFLKYLNRKNLAIGTEIEVLEREAFDDSVHIRTEGKSFYITRKVAENLLLKLKGR